MTGFVGWVNPETMRLMGMALLHFLWQGAALAAVAFLAMSLPRRASAKYLIGVAMLASMVVAPAATYVVLSQRYETVGVGAARSASTAKMETLPSTSSAANQFFNPDTSDSREPLSIYLLWFVEAWFLE